MSYKGNNILGDKKYKKKFKKIKNIDTNFEKMILKLDRQFLHAKLLGFTHPKSGEELRVLSHEHEEHSRNSSPVHRRQSLDSSKGKRDSFMSS